MTDTSGAGGPPADGSRRGRRERDLRISADASSNSLVVAATKEMHDEVARLLAEMDKPTLETAVRVIPLNQADPTEVAQTLRNLYASRTAGGRRGAPGRTSPAQSVTIEAGPRLSWSERPTRRLRGHPRPGRAARHGHRWLLP